MTSKRWPLYAIAALFAGPLVLAVLLYAGRGALDFGALPNPDRELIATPANLDGTALERPDGSLTDSDWARYRWSLIYARMSRCERQCGDALTRLSQVRAALGEDRDRVQLVFIAPSADAGDGAGGGFAIGLIDGRHRDELIRAFGSERLEQGRYFVVDPLGNVILSYPDDADQTRLLDDLERLLDVSRVG
ncbi:MAG: hypothetical protein R3305_01240 [Gammaproteobacteria bacterium]|nr:hypothetical protein [Gammaproteobacteria bacterium]